MRLVLFKILYKVKVALDRFYHRFAFEREYESVKSVVEASGREIIHHGPLLEFEIGHPPIKIFARKNSSDLAVAQQVFIGESYDGLCENLAIDKPVIFDLGGNIGATALYFLTKKPQAVIYAVEADQENFELMKKNLAANQAGEQVKPIHRAIWNSTEALWLQNTFRDKRSWSRNFSSAKREGQPQVQGMRLVDVAKENNVTHVHLLKMDIEGSEQKVMEDGESKKFIAESVSLIAMEIHPEISSVNNWKQFLQEAGFFIFSRGELLVAFKNRG